MNSPIPWIGGKRALLSVILEHFPINYERYIEVFGGGGSVLFGKPSEVFEVYNDFDSDLVNFFRCVKYRTMALLNELKCLPVNSREDFKALKCILNGENYYEKFLQEETEIAEKYFADNEKSEIMQILSGRANDFDVIRAAAFYKQCHYSYASNRKTVNCSPFKITNTFTSILKAYYRLENVFIDNKDFEALIRQYDRDNAFFYCDPPYFMTEKYYKAVFLQDDHVRLFNTLKGIKGKFMLSYNDCEFIRELYKDYTIIEVERLSNIIQRYEAGGQYKEVLIINFDLSECMKNKNVQMTML